MPGIDARAAGADAHEQRFVGVAKLRADALLDALERRGDLFVEALRVLVRLRKRVARLGRDREARRNRQAERRHLGEPGAFAAEQIAPHRIALGAPLPEEIHVFTHGNLFGGGAYGLGRGFANRN